MAVTQLVLDKGTHLTCTGPMSVPAPADGLQGGLEAVHLAVKEVDPLFDRLQLGLLLAEHGDGVGKGAGLAVGLHRLVCLLGIDEGQRVATSIVGSGRRLLCLIGF